MERRERGFLALGIVGAIVFLAALASVETSSGFTALDAPVADRLSRFPEWYGAGLDLLGSIIVIGPLVTVSVLYLAWKRAWWGASKLVVPVVAAEAITLLVKTIVARERPLNVHETGFSFPSGHATNAAALACLAAWFALARPRPRLVVVGLVAAGSAWAVAMAMARVAYGVHFASDVIGGLGLGAAVGAFGLVGLSRLEARRTIAARG